MRFTVVGCAGSYPSATSAASCYLIEETDDAGRTWRIVLDLGSGALGPLQRHVAPRDLDAVFLSHLHPDHCLDLCGLYVALHYDPAGPPAQRLPVHGPTNTFERLEQAYGEHEHGSLAKSYAVHTYTEAQPITVGPFRVVPRRVLHPVEAFGLRVECAHAALAYSGDSDACDGLVELALDVDLLVAEASFVEGRDLIRGVHLTGRRAGEVATQAGAASLVLTHQPAWNDQDVVLAQAGSAYDGPTQMAFPGLTIDLGRSRPQENGTAAKLVQQPGGAQ